MAERFRAAAKLLREQAHFGVEIVRCSVGKKRHLIENLSKRVRPSFEANERLRAASIPIGELVDRVRKRLAQIIGDGARP